MPLLMLLPVLGGALFLRRLFALTDSASILITVSGFLLLTYLVGLLGILQAGVYLITGLGLLLLVWELRIIFLSRKLFFSFPFLLFLVLPILYWLVHAESKPMFWDEYSHWGVYIREMASTHEFYTADTNAAHPDYPPGAPLWQYFFTLLPGYGEGTVYLAQFILLITPLMVLFETLTLPKWFWVPALLALCVLGLANLGHGIVSLSTDHQLSVWYSGVMLQAVLPGKKSLLEIGVLALPLAVILLIKDTGLLLAASAVFLIICLMVFRHYQQHKNFLFQRKFLLAVLILVVFPLAFQASWKLNRKLEGIGSKREGTGLISILLTGKTNFSDQEMRIYRKHFWEVLIDQQISRNEISQHYNAFGYRLMPQFTDNFRLTLLGLFLIFPLWSIVIVFFSKESKKYEYGIVLFTMFLTSVSYIFIIFLTYPLIYQAEYALNLSSFLRYAHTIVLPMLILGIGLLAPAFQSSPFSNHKGFYPEFPSIIFGIALLLLLVFETPHIKPFYTTASYENNPSFKASKWRKDSDSSTMQIKKTIGKAKLWIYLPIKDNGLLATILRYQMTPVKTVISRDPKLLNNPQNELLNIWHDHEYLWFPVENMEYDVLFQTLFGKINSRLFKVIKGEGYLDLEGVPVSK